MNQICTYKINLVFYLFISLFIFELIPDVGAANANLFVSAENSQYNNYFGGPMVLEIVIIDSDIRSTGEAKGEPDVTVNGKIVTMVQAVDGLWYGYIADVTQALIADATVIHDGAGLDFGTFCSPGSGIFGVSTTDARGIAIPFLTSQGIGEGGDINGNKTILANCDIDVDGEPDMFDLNDRFGADIDSDGDGVDDDFTYGNGNIAMNVLREAKPITPEISIGSRFVALGQIGLANEALWPFIQLYDFNPTGNVIVQYNKGGNPQTVTLTFDTLDS